MRRGIISAMVASALMVAGCGGLPPPVHLVVQSVSNLPVEQVAELRAPRLQAASLETEIVSVTDIRSGQQVVSSDIRRRYDEIKLPPGYYRVKFVVWAPAPGIYFIGNGDCQGLVGALSACPEVAIRAEAGHGYQFFGKTIMDNKGMRVEYQDVLATSTTNITSK